MHLLFCFILRWLTSLNAFGIIEWDGFDDQFKGYSLFGGKSETVIGEDVDNNVGLKVDGEGNAIDVLTFIADKFFRYSGEVLS